jgi:hypothetical protein
MEKEKHSKLLMETVHSFISVEHSSIEGRYVWFAVDPSNDRESEWGEYHSCLDIHDPDDHTTIKTFSSPLKALERAKYVLMNSSHHISLAKSIMKEERQYKKTLSVSNTLLIE